ncbi:MAG: winged helix-turn-helix transcriptional regulator [Candidatus Thorarchaeota archaeon]
MTVNRTNESDISSPLTEMFSHLGRPWTVPLIIALGERSYNTDVGELRNSIDSSNGRKLSVSTISRCLSDLAQIGIVEGTVHAHSPPKAEYSLTSAGQQLYRHLLQIRHLAERASLEHSFTDSVSAC